MSEPAFENLVKILDQITVDELQSVRSTSGKVELMTPTHIVMMGLLYCAGKDFCSLSDIYGPKKRHIMSCIKKFLDAVDFSTDPMLTSDLLPRSSVNLKKSTDEWVKKSSAFNLFMELLEPLLMVCCKPHRNQEMSPTQQTICQGIIINSASMCKLSVTSVSD